MGSCFHFDEIDVNPYGRFHDLFIGDSFTSKNTTLSLVVNYLYYRDIKQEKAEKVMQKITINKVKVDLYPHIVLIDSSDSEQE